VAMCELRGAAARYPSGLCQAIFVTMRTASQPIPASPSWQGRWQESSANIISGSWVFRRLRLQALRDDDDEHGYPKEGNRPEAVSSQPNLRSQPADD
jgi:hypothetical protein